MAELEALTPHPFQEHDIQRLVANGGSGLVAAGTGAGKTLVAAEVIRRVEAKVVLIVAPQGTHRRAWARTLVRQGLPEPRRLIGTKPGKAAWADLMWGVPGVYITTPQWFARQNWSAVKPDMAVIDEIHMLTRYGNPSQKKLFQLKPDIRLGMSGTPLRNSWDNAWSLANWIEPDIIPMSYWSWRISNMNETTFDRYAPQNRRLVGEKEPGKLFNSLSCYVYHTQRGNCCDFHPNGFLADLKEPEERIIELEMTAAQKKFYKQMEKEYVAWLTTPDETGRVPVVAELPIVARGMLRFAALGEVAYDEERGKLFFPENVASPKLDQLISDLESMDGGSVLVLTHSQQFASVMSKRVQNAGYSVFEWSGAATQKKRDEALESFIAGDLQVIVAVISAIGTGSDGLQEACNNEVWVSLSDDNTDNEQGRGRLDRMGQKTQVIRSEYRMMDTFDMGMLSSQLLAALKLNESLRKEAA